MCDSLLLPPTPPSTAQDNWDMLSVLLMIRVNHSQRKVMGSRRVPCLDDYLDRVQLMLWPRFKVREGGIGRP